AFLVSSRAADDGSVAYQTIRNAFLEVPLQEFAMNMLKKANVSYVEAKKGSKKVLYVLGDASLQMASIFKEADFRRPLAKGVLAKGEVQAIEVLSNMLKELLGEPSEPGESCYFSVPADARDTGQDARYHEAQIAKIIETLGYTPKGLNEAHAVIFATCRESDFSGLSFSFGAGMVNACLAYKSLPVLEFAVARGGDWIDEKAADSMGKGVPQITVLKEKEWDLRDPKKREHEALAVYYKELIKYLIDNLEDVFEENEPALIEPIPVVVSGGTSLVKGFIEVFEQELRSRDLPIEISEVRHAKNPMNSVAAGLLMAAMLSG
ncbi:MAG: cell division protein FtsA, partial [Dehalococcoidia bacterium]|nr:cell division protein FtsA [Dehalococcoidia bacterium]